MQDTKKQIGSLIDEIFEKTNSDNYLDSEQRDVFDIIKDILKVIEKIDSRIDKLLELIQLTNDRITENENKL